ncbi:MAG: IS21 family transposase [Caulobacterales bacterium]
MYKVVSYEVVRRAVFVEGLSHREAAERFDKDPRTIKKMCTYSAPPGYRRAKPPARPKLDPFLGVIDQILASDLHAPVKQRHTCKRIFERLRDEHGYTGGATVVKDYVRGAKITAREMFVPLAHPPGHAQVDFGEAVAVVDGVRQKIHFFCMDLPQSDGCFVKAYPAETTEAFLDGHVAAFEFFGGVPISILYDNLKIAVARILGDGKRVRSRAFSELQSHFLFTDRFGRPGKGNDKGHVEGLVKYSRKNFMVPIPHAPSFAALNADLLAACSRRQQDVLRGFSTTIAARMTADIGAFRQDPVGPFEPCEKIASKVSAFSMARYRTNDYSVPTRFGHRDILIKGFVDEVIIICGAEIIARHPRSYAKADLVFDPLHYLELLERKPGALDQAAALQGWGLPEEFATLRRLLESRMQTRGRREYIQVLRLLEIFELVDVVAAIRSALSLSAISFDAVKQLTLARIERRVVKLDLDAYPHLPRADVQATKASDYLALITRVA